MTNFQIEGACPYCSPHGGAVLHPTKVCPKVKAIEYHPDGSTKRVEFKGESDADVFINSLSNPTWADYVATNLLDALEQVPDTGDWHGALRMWCERTKTGSVKPNRRP